MTRTARVAWSVVAAVLILVGAVLMGVATRDVDRASDSSGAVPVRVVAPADAGPDAPALVLAHGFAGSAAMMDPMATALARAGHLVVLPDLPGHGANAELLTDDSLEPAIAAAVEAARSRTT